MPKSPKEPVTEIDIDEDNGIDYSIFTTPSNVINISSAPKYVLGARKLKQNRKKTWGSFDYGALAELTELLEGRGWALLLILRTKTLCDASQDQRQTLDVTESLRADLRLTKYHVRQALESLRTHPELCTITQKQGNAPQITLTSDWLKRLRG